MRIMRWRCGTVCALAVTAAGSGTAQAAEAIAAPSTELLAGAVAALGVLALAVVWHRLSVARGALLAAEQALADGQTLADAAPSGSLHWSPVGGVVVSRTAAELLGLDPSAGPDADVTATLSEADAAVLRNALDGLRREETRFTVIAEAAGGARVLRFRGVPAGGVHGPVVWIDDVTVSERALAEAREQAGGLRALLDQLPVPVWRRGRDLGIDYANRAYMAAVEAAPDGAGGPLPELAPGVIGRKGRALAERALETGEPQSETHHIVMNGARHLVALSEQPLGDGGVVAGFALDKTDVEDMRRDLARHIAGHEDVLHNLGTAIAIYDADQTLQFFNNAFVQLWGLDEPWLRSRPAMGEVLEALRERRRLPEYADFPAFKRDQLSLFTKLIEPIEELIHLPDGKAFRSIVSPHPFGGLLLTWEDVTDALALERSYNTLIDVQRETLDNLYEGVALIGGDGRLKLTNPAFARMWQLPAATLSRGPHVSSIVERMKDLLEEGSDWPAQTDEILGLLTDREPQSGRLERSDGSVLDYATVPLPDGAVLLSFVDVSDSIRVERALRERNEALETADRLKSEFIANVSYELRTPLNTIIGFAEILAGQYFGELNERQIEYGQGILESSQRLLSLINDILDLASIEAGHMVLELETLDTYELLEAVLGLTRERARKKRIALELDCPVGIGPIVADERRLKQAFFNILSNAVKFTPEQGSIRVSARREGEEMVLTFADTGIGMSDTERDRAFGRFERGDSAEARRSGAGLGLSLVKSFVELHGGRVTLNSEPGLGTRVVCRIPARRIEAEPQPRAQAG